MRTHQRWFQMGLACVALVSACGCSGVSNPTQAPDGGAAAVSAFQQYCRAMKEANCGPRCLYADDAALAACRQAAREECLGSERVFRAMEDAGKARFNADAVPGCLEDMAAWVALQGDFACTGTWGSEEELRAAYMLECVDGRAHYRFPLESCLLDVVNGTVPVGGACAVDAECAADTVGNAPCEGVSADGCGTCAPPLRSVGEPCVVQVPGGQAYRQCVVGASCDYQGDGTCKAERRPGETCGDGIGTCAAFAACGTVCAPVGDGGSRCQVPAQPGQSCQESFLCAAGSSCVSVAGDAGYVRTCVPYVAEGEPCADGQRYDFLGYGGVSGEYSMCGDGYFCDVEFPAQVGTCRAPTQRITGEPCSSSRDDVCMVPGDACRFINGSAQCLPRPGLDEPCAGDGECIPGLYCVLGEQGEAGHCAPYLREGAPCADGRGCAADLRCFNGWCVTPAETYQPYQARCP